MNYTIKPKIACLVELYDENKMIGTYIYFEKNRIEKAHDDDEPLDNLPTFVRDAISTHFNTEFEKPLMERGKSRPMTIGDNS